MSPRPATTRVNEEQVLGGVPSKRTLEVYKRLAEITSGSMVVRYDRNDLRRLFEASEDDDGETMASVRRLGPEDPLGVLLFDGMDDLPKDRKRPSDPGIQILDSVGILVSDDVREYNPRLWVLFDLRAEVRAQVRGAMTAVDFVADSSFSTGKLTPQYCRQHNIPKLDRSWILVDVVSSSKKGSATLLLLHAWLACIRLRRTGIVAIGASDAGKAFFAGLGFQHYREVYWMKLTDLNLVAIHKRLKVDKMLVSDACWRRGLTAKTAASVIARC